MELIYEILKDVLEPMPSELWGLAVVTIWTLWSLYFRFVTVGKQASLPDLMLEGASLKLSRDDSPPASEVWDCQFQPASNSQPASAETQSDASRPSTTENLPPNAPWRFRHLAIAYVLFRAMGYAVLFTAFIIFFVACAVGMFLIAQPKAGISIEAIGSWFATASAIPLTAFIGLSLVKILAAVHKMPLMCLSKCRDRDIILLGW